MDAYSIEACSSSEEEDNESLSSDDELINRMKLSKHSNDVEIDEFEKEMNDELEQMISSYNKASGSLSVDLPTSAGGNESASLSAQKGEETVDPESKEEAHPGETAEIYYDESYFSSGSDDDCDRVGGEKSRSDSRRRVQTNDDLFYDPDMDDEDERWMNKQRQHYRKAQNKSHNLNSPGTSYDRSRGEKAIVEAVPASDAILACPACMTTLCIDCQRHELYKMQFRAMFVINCSVARNELLKYDEPASKRKQKNKRKKASGKLVAAAHSENSAQPLDLYHPVKCGECGTEVAVLDKEEVYHFFNVVESLA